MENTQKTPEQWFQKLKEPYRSEAIAAIDETNSFYTNQCESLTHSIGTAFNWRLSKKGYDYWAELHNSIIAGETTYLEPENVSLINEVNNSQVTEQQKEKWSEKIDEIVDTHVVQKLKPEQKNSSSFIDIESVQKRSKEMFEKTLKEFNSLKPEPVELRPEDLVSGEVYRTKGTFDWIFIFSHTEIGQVWHKKRLCLNDNTLIQHNGWFVNSIRFFHATPEEKALLLGEEETDWEAKYNELLDVVEEQKKIITMLREEPKGEKVYFYHDGISWSYSKSLDDILVASREDYEIYQAIVIGKKKSVLVSE